MEHGSLHGSIFKVLPTTTTKREESKVEKLEIYYSVSLVVDRKKSIQKNFHFA
jgi:hypothetical protein